MEWIECDRGLIDFLPHPSQGKIRYMRSIGEKRDEANWR
jgi:hypothetical protein